MSRALVHTYLGDRRGLIDAVQVQIVGRLDTWAGHGLQRATTRGDALRALVQGTFSFVDGDRDAWGVLGTTGGFDHPAMHGLRARWTSRLSPDERGDDLAGQAAVGALLGGVASWVNRGVDPNAVIAALAPLLRGEAPDGAPAG